MPPLHLVGEYGGGVLIVLFLFLYVCLSILLRRKIPKPLSQVTGTVLLYFCAALLLGLLNLSRTGYHTIPVPYGPYGQVKVRFK